MKTRLLAVGLALASALANAQTPPAAPAPDEHAWQAWSAAVEQTLRTSRQPRDWALAAVSMAGSPAADTAADALLQRALAAAPDDVLVHWLAAQHASRQKQDELAARSASVLTRLEPDNAASWLPAAALAARAGDAAALDAALARMATATRCDSHFADALSAWIEAYERQPIPGAGTSDAPTAAFTAALARASALAIPAYAPLMAACRDNDGTSVPAQRRAHCNAVGHLLLQQGPTLIDRDVGAGLLRHGGDATLTEADRAMQRRLAWHRQQATALALDEDPAALRAYAADWRTRTDETEVIERALRRAGLPTEPPADWIPPRLDGA